MGPIGAKPRRRLGLVGGLLVALVVAAPGFSQEVESFSIEWIDRSSFPVNIVYYSTFAPDGEPAEAFWASEDVTVFENGVAHEANDFEDGDHAPAYVSLIIDSSGSMEGRLAEVLKAARTLISQLDGGDRGEVIDFDSGVVTRRSFTRSHDEMVAALEEISVGGGTALYDAVATGLDHLGGVEGMKTVIVLSDGEDENSTVYTFDRLKERLEAEGVRVFTIALGEGVDTATMSQIAELSEGTFHHAATADDVDEIYSGIIAYLHSLHRMWYSTSLGMFDGSARTVRIEDRRSGLSQTGAYRAPEGEYWSHALTPRVDDRHPARIRPDGSYAAFYEYMAIVAASGRRLTRHDWSELYDAEMTESYICGYAHRNYGAMAEYDPADGSVAWVEPQEIYGGAAGDFHREWSWYPKGISPNERFLVMAADPDEEGLEYDYYFMLLDRESEEVRWERGFYQGEFDEPGPVTVADTGVAAVVQDANLFMVDPAGELRFSMMWEETGRRWDRLAMSADGSHFIGRAGNDDWVALYTGEGTLVWEQVSDCHEKAGYVSVSPNGRYFGYADSEGPHIYDSEGQLLYELSRDDPAAPSESALKSGCSIDIANDGSFVFTIGSRMYYRELDL